MAHGEMVMIGAYVTCCPASGSGRYLRGDPDLLIVTRLSG